MKLLRFWSISVLKASMTSTNISLKLYSFHKYPLSINYMPWMLLGFSNIVILYLMQLQCEETDCK